MPRSRRARHHPKSAALRADGRMAAMAEVEKSKSVRGGRARARSALRDAAGILFWSLQKKSAPAVRTGAPEELGGARLSYGWSPTITRMREQDGSVFGFPWIRGSLQGKIPGGTPLNAFAMIPRGFSSLASALAHRELFGLSSIENAATPVTVTPKSSPRSKPIE